MVTGGRYPAVSVLEVDGSVASLQLHPLHIELRGITDAVSGEVVYGVAASLRLVSDPPVAVAAVPHTEAFTPNPTLNDLVCELAREGARIQLFYPLTCDDAHRGGASQEHLRQLCSTAGAVGFLNSVLPHFVNAVISLRFSCRWTPPSWSSKALKRTYRPSTHALRSFSRPCFRE